MSQQNQRPPNEQQNNLHIDNVVASHPELGPTPPNGGYGWIILICAMMLQLTVPSLTVAYGMLILYSNLQEEYEENEVFKIWKHSFVVVPVLTVIVSCLSTSWSRAIISISNRPRIVSISGIFLLAAGILLSSIGIDSDDDTTFNLFAGFIAGIGTSLVNQQADMLLSHYFSTKLGFVRSIYKISILFGNIVISLLMGGLYVKHGYRTSLIIYTGIILQNCIVLIGFTRPTYIVASIQKNYKELKEASEDEDEEIYSSQNETQNTNNEVVNDNQNEPISSVSIHDDEQDEDVINTFNTQHIVKQVVINLNPVAISRMETDNRVFNNDTNNSYERFSEMEPQSLYRETTIANDNNQNVFNFEPTFNNTNSIRRTSTIKKNMIILLSLMKDVKFYIYTYIDLNVKLSMTIISLLLPAYISQQIPDMEMWTVTGMIVIIYIGSTCTNIVIVLLPTDTHKKFYLALFSLLSFAGLICLSESNTKPLLMISSMMSSFAITALYIRHQPIYSNIKVDQEANVMCMASNFIITLIILVILMIGNYSYVVYFKIAGAMQLLSPILLSLIRKSP